MTPTALTTDVLAKLVVQNPVCGAPGTGFFLASIFPITLEVRLATSLKTVEQRAATAAAKVERARDAAQAMLEYEAQRVAVLANTARLRALPWRKNPEMGLAEANRAWQRQPRSERSFRFLHRNAPATHVRYRRESGRSTAFFGVASACVAPSSRRY